MRLILAGQKSFGAAALRAVLEAGHDVAAVWAPEYDDKLAWAARGLGLEWVMGREDPDGVAERKVDLIVAAHSHAFISRRAREATRLGGIGYHPSLLPRHRGRDAVEWTIRMGDKVAGGSVYWLTDNVDGGPLAAQSWCWVRPGWDASKLWREELFPMGVRLLLKVLADLDRGVIVEETQPEEMATWEPSIERPPLWRPDLLQLGATAGAGRNGYVHQMKVER